MSTNKQLDVPALIRSLVFDRDGESCRICGSFKKLEIHHILPRGLGREHDICNLVLVCSVCHDLIEAGQLPAWHQENKENLYHLNPVKAFSHFKDFSQIICKTHDKLLSEEFKKEPISVYKIKHTNPVFN